MGGLKKAIIEREREKSAKRKPKNQKPINWELVDSLLMAGCTGIEVASYFDLHHERFYERVEEEYNISFTEYASQKRAKGDSLLKHAQFVKAIGKTKVGDNQLLIWLGKNRLDQRETPPEDKFSPQAVEQFKALMTQFEMLQSLGKKDQEDRNIDDKSNSDESKS